MAEMASINVAIAPKPPNRMQRARELPKTAKILLSLVLPALILVLWHFAVERAWVQRGLFPSPTKTAIGAYQWIFGGGSGLGQYSGTWLQTVWVSTKRVFAGFAIAGVAGVLMGVAIARSAVVAALMEPLFHIIRPIPIPAWIPFSLIFFGISFFSSVFLIVLAAFPPVVINTMTGVSSVDPLLIRAGGMLGASKKRILFTIVLPGALPNIFAGLRLAIGMSWLAVVVSELVGVQSGIGYTIFESYNFNRVDILIADMVTVGVLGLLSDRILTAISAPLTAWATARR
jgi:NitT/TauT family transport system permease protein